MVMGQVAKGIVMLVVAILLNVATGCVAVVVTFPVSIIDAYLIAKKLQRGRKVGEWEFF